MIYSFRPGYSLPVPAQVIGETLARLEALGNLSPATVVKVARPGTSPLHPAFEWDDSVAANLYREDQAREMIRSVQVVTDGAKEGETPSRIAFVSVGTSIPGGAKYVTSARAMSDAEMREKVLGDAIRALEGLRARYGHLEELAEVFAALEGIAAPAVA